MKGNRLNMYKFPCGRMAAAVIMLAGVMGCTATQALAENPAGPDLRLGAGQYPDDDAIILRWEQHWTQDRDGTVHRRDHKWVKLLHDRPIGRFGDPRIPFVKGQQELIIHKAQTILPDGTIQPVPDYSFNIAAPDDIAGWPESAGWNDQIVSFGGVQDNCVLELDYEIVTPARVLPWIEADIRLDDAYPVIERIVSVTVPKGFTPHYQIDRALGVRQETQHSTTDGSKTSTYRWTAANLPGARDEARALPWTQRCPRLRFTTCPDVEIWARTITQRVDQAGQADETIKKFAEAAVEEERDPTEQVRKLAKKVHDSFNFVTSPKALLGLPCRGAGDVLRANYGNPLESAALLLAAVRSLGIKASVAVGVDATAWNESDTVEPTESAFSGVVVVADLPEGPVYVHPRRGIFRNPGNWGRRWLLGEDANGRLEKTYVYARGENEPSELTIAGKIAVDKEGVATGELRIRLTGGFYDPGALETADAQKSLVTNMVGRVLSDFEVTGHSVLTLSEQVLKVTANVASKEALKSYSDRHMLKFGDGPAFLPEFPLPLHRSHRTTDVHVDGQLREQVDLTVELPEEWKVFVTPASPPPVEDATGPALGTTDGPWGRVAQKVEVDGQNVRFHRTIAITANTISPGKFARLRQAVNELRATKSLILVCGK